MVQAGGVELVELEVGHPAAGAPGHGDTVAAGAIRVAGIQVGLAGAAGGEHNGPAWNVDPVTVAIEDVGALAAGRPARPGLPPRAG